MVQLIAEGVSRHFPNEMVRFKTLLYRLIAIPALSGVFESIDAYERSLQGALGVTLC